MITSEQDPDVVRWGLQLFDGDPYSNYGYCGCIAQQDNEYRAGHYDKDHCYGSECNHSLNNEFAINSIQEELSQLAVSQPAESLELETEQTQPSLYSPDWFPQTFRNYSFGEENCCGDTTDLRSCTLCCSPGEESFCGEEWSYLVEQMDEYDGEVGKRLNQMVPIPHIPRTNRDIPSVEEATLDHQRLLDRLRIYELEEFQVQGDGNCQFRALSDQFYRTPEHHKFVRQQVVNQLRSCPEVYEGYIPMAYEQYLKKMSKNGEWGDHITLQAAADTYGVKIFVITSFKDTCYIEILPTIPKSERVIFLSFWAEVHYNSIYPEGELPTFETKREWPDIEHEYSE